MSKQHFAKTGFIARIGIVGKVAKSIFCRSDYVLHPDNAEELLKAVQRVPGVITADDLRTQKDGRCVYVDLKISVNPKISVLDGYDIAKLVRHQLLHRFNHISDVTVHVSPYDLGYPYKHNVDSAQNDFPTLLH